jgi:hypothetical protein
MAKAGVDTGANMFGVEPSPVRGCPEGGQGDDERAEKADSAKHAANYRPVTAAGQRR